MPDPLLELPQQENRSRRLAVRSQIFYGFSSYMMLTSDSHRPLDSMMKLPHAAAMTDYFCARLSSRNERPKASGMNGAGGRIIQGLWWTLNQQAGVSIAARDSCNNECQTILTRI